MNYFTYKPLLALVQAVSLAIAPTAIQKTMPQESTLVYTYEARQTSFLVSYALESLILNENKKDTANHLQQGKGALGEATALIPGVLRRIAQCESGNRHFNENGQVIRGKENPNDIGRYQINLKFHLETAQKLGYDIFTEEGNEAYALWLYERNGTKDWKYSSNCWSKET